MVLMLLGVMGLWALVLLGLIFTGDDTIILAGTGVVSLLIFATMVPTLDIIGKAVMRFPGTGTPIPMDKLLHTLKAVNDRNTAVIVQEKKPGHLIITWNYVDAKWWGILSKQGRRSIYQLHVKLDEKKHRATLIDVMKNVKWSAGPDGVKLSGGYFRGIAIEADFGKAWGITEAWKFGKVYDYSFKNTEIKYPVLHTLQQNGWDVRMGMW